MTPEMGAEMHESKAVLCKSRASVGEIWVWLPVLCGMDQVAFLLQLWLHAPWDGKENK